MLRRMVTVLTVPVALIVLAGSAFGQNYDTLADEELRAMDDSLQYALEYNPADQPAEWRNPDTGRAGAAVPVRTFTNSLDQPCREFFTTVTIGGREEQAFGTACRQEDGDWKIVSGQQAAPVRVYTRTVPVRYDYAERYYSHPYGYYAPFNIFFSFSSVHRGGGHHRVHHIDGRDFRHRYPVHVKERVHVGRYDDHRRGDGRGRGGDDRGGRGGDDRGGRGGGGRGGDDRGGRGGRR